MHTRVNTERNSTQCGEKASKLEEDDGEKLHLDNEKVTQNCLFLTLRTI